MYALGSVKQTTAAQVPTTSPSLGALLNKIQQTMKTKFRNLFTRFSLCSRLRGKQRRKSELRDRKKYAGKLGRRRVKNSMNVFSKQYRKTLKKTFL
jgi:folate-dependent tRNA-U54 methylase TrmFO/GidA